MPEYTCNYTAGAASIPPTTPRLIEGSNSSCEFHHREEIKELFFFGYVEIRKTPISIGGAVRQGIAMAGGSNAWMVEGQQREAGVWQLLKTW
jgi:hypothetical protein